MDYQDIIETLLHGNITDAIDAIEAGGAVMAAMVLVQGADDGLITRTDARLIATCLVQRQIDRNAQ